jgi:hypothetical protein
MKNIKLIFCSLIYISSLSANASDFTLESGVMDWSHKAEKVFGKQRSENAFVKLHGYNATDFGDLYGNVLIEDPDDQEEMGIEVVLIGQIIYLTLILMLIVRFMLKMNLTGLKPLCCQVLVGIKFLTTGCIFSLL